MKNQEENEPQLYFPDDLISEYTAFKERVYSPKSVLYPSCDFEASSIKVFDNVTFVDINSKPIELMKKAGFKAYAQNIKDYKPAEAHDLLILLNPAIPTEWASRHLLSGAWIISNNYHGNASEMHSEPQKFTLWGKIDFVERDRIKKDNKVIISQDIAGLFESVKDEEELKKLRPDYHEFASTAYPHLLRQMGITPEKRFDDMYRQYKKEFGESEKLPSKRVADKYIFVKKQNGF